MFSLAAKPFNSKRRQLYGGWTTALNANSTLDNSGWQNDGAKYFRDTKWASMAEKYATDPRDRDLAATIRSLSKGVLKSVRTRARAGDGGALGWLADYNRAAKNTRSKLRMSSLPSAKRSAVWRKFLSTPWNDNFDNNTKLWLTMANRAPYGAAPTLPQGYAVPDVDDFVSGLAYAPPSKLTLETRRALARARSGTYETYLRALSAFNDNIMGGMDVPVALAAARRIDPTFEVPEGFDNGDEDEEMGEPTI